MNVPISWIGTPWIPYGRKVAWVWLALVLVATSSAASPLAVCRAPRDLTDETFCAVLGAPTGGAVLGLQEGLEDPDRQYRMNAEHVLPNLGYLEPKHQISVTVLLAALMRGLDESTIRNVLEAGADSNTNGSAGSPSPLLAAALMDDAASIEALVEAGADIDSDDPVDAETLMVFGLHHGVSAERGTEIEITALAAAAGGNNVRATNALLELGADPALAANGEFLPLQLAAQRGNVEILEALLPYATPEGISAALMAAIVERRLAAVRRLIDARTWDTADESLREMLVIAAALNLREILEQFASTGVAMDGVGDDGRSLLHVAAAANATATADWLISQGLALSAVDATGNTPLHVAVLSGHHTMAAALIRAGTFVDIRLPDGRTPLHIAAAAGDREAVVVLLEAGAATGATDDEGNTADGLASKYGNETIHQLIASAYLN